MSAKSILLVMINAFLMVVCLGTGCTRPLPSVRQKTPFPETRMAIQLLNYQGELVAEGWISSPLQKNGTWAIRLTEKAKSDSVYSGLPFGKGSYLRTKKSTLNLQPKMVDHNIWLDFVGKNAGTWLYTSFAGDRRMGLIRIKAVGRR